MNFTPSQEETRLIDAILAKLNAQDFAFITRERVDEDFAGFGLPVATLDKIWQLADADENKFLSGNEVAVAIRLVGWAQSGEEPSKELLQAIPPIPTLKGIHPRGFSFNPTPSAQTSKSKDSDIPQLTAEDRSEFQTIFYQLGPINGLLSSDEARSYFQESRLPTRHIDQIWRLADPHKRNALDCVGFVIAVFLIRCAVSKKLLAIPSTLPSSLYEQASRGAYHQPTSSHSQRQTTEANNIHYSHIENTQPSLRFGMGPPPFSPDNTFDLHSQATPQPLKTPTQGSFVRPSTTISQEAKATFDAIFARLDTQKRGSIDGNVAAEYMLQTKIPVEVLSKIWDKVDANRDGELSPDEFALAMHYMHRVLEGDGHWAESPKSYQATGLETTPDLYSKTWPGATSSVESPSLRMPVPSIVPSTKGATHVTPVDNRHDPAIGGTTRVQAHSPNGCNAFESTTSPTQPTGIKSQEANESDTSLIRQQLTELEEQLTVEERQLTAKGILKAQQDSRLAKVREEAFRLKNEVKAMQDKRDQLNQELKDVETQISQDNHEIARMKAEAAALGPEMRHLSSLVEMAKERLACVESEKTKLRAAIDEKKEQAGNEQKVQDTNGLRSLDEYLKSPTAWHSLNLVAHRQKIGPFLVFCLIIVFAHFLF